MGSFEKIRTFLSEVRTEFRKVNWPKPDELKESTTVVIVAVLVITLFVTVVDFVLNKVLTLFVGI